MPQTEQRAQLPHFSSVNAHPEKILAEQNECLILNKPQDLLLYPQNRVFCRLLAIGISRRS